MALDGRAREMAATYLTSGLTRLDSDTRIEPGLGGGGWAAATDAGSGLLNLVIDGEEGAESAVDRRRIREAIHKVRVEDDDVASLLEQIRVLTACGGGAGRCCGLRLLHKWLVRPEWRAGR
jgi:hypothetical protein